MGGEGQRGRGAAIQPAGHVQVPPPAVARHRRGPLAPPSPALMTTVHCTL